MLTKTRAIVLHSFKYGEQQMIVDLLTETCGRTSCIIRMPKSAKGKLKKQYFQPLFILDTDIDIRQKANLQHLRDARIAVPFMSIPFNPYKMSISLFMAEFLRCTTRREQTDPTTFSYIENSIRWLDGCASGFSNFHIVFMMRLSKFLGFYPNTDNYEPGDWFDMRSSCFSNQRPMHADVLSPDNARKIGLLLRMNYATMHLYRMSHFDRNRMVDTIIRYYRIHMPDLPELKSLQVLKELFAD